MVIKNLPIKVWLRGIDYEDRRDMSTRLSLAVDQDFNFPLLPAVDVIDIEVNENQLTIAPQWFTCCETWEQTLEYVKRINKKRPRFFWIEIYGAKVATADAVSTVRKLNPTFRYELTVKQFSVLTWPNDKLAPHYQMGMDLRK